MHPLVEDRSVRRRPRRWILSALALAGLPFLMTGCDNPACVFGGDCDSDGSGGGVVGEGAATAPVNGEWISNLTPQITRFHPNANGADTRTPIVLVFNESLSTTGLNQAFEIATDIGFPDPLAIAQLVGDGRVLCLFPATELTPNTPYEIRFRQGAVVRDRTGQQLIIPSNSSVGRFRTAATNGVNPSVLTTYPLGGADFQSETTEIVVAFDRPMNASTVTTASFLVTVAGASATPGGTPSALSLLGGGTESRVFRWRNGNSSPNPPPLGAPDSAVTVTLSPAGSPIRDTANANLSTTTFSFDLAPFATPTSAAITSDPTDAIGIAQISGPANLAIQVGLSGAQSGDRLQVFMFGAEPNVEQNPEQIALAREVLLDAATTSFTLTAADLNLLASSSPVEARFGEGPVAFAFQLRRGNSTSALLRLDVDSLTDGFQDPILDTEVPQILGLSTAGNVIASYRSDVRDLVIVGRASEELTGALVTTTASEDNLTTGGPNPPRVSGSHESGLFVAAPVPLGVLPQSATRSYTVTVYDRALNASGSATGTFEQIGASALGNPMPDPDVAVFVFDSTTLAPIANARVLTHQNIAGAVTAVPGGSVLTDAAGEASVPASTTGETILTVDGSAIGYGIFTFDALPTDEIDVPLQPTALAATTAQGTVTSPDEDIDDYTVEVADARVPEIGESLSDVGVCIVDPFGFDMQCNYTPFPIRPRRIGALSAMAVTIPPNPFVYSPLIFFKGFGLTLPLPPATAGGLDNAAVAVPFLLEGAIDAEEFAIDVPEQDFDSSSYAFDPLFDSPRVRVESLSPGIQSPVVTGRGVAFANGPNAWTIRAAYPGAADGIQDIPADELGRLVTDGAVQADHFLCIEVVDDGGNWGGTRHRFSNLAGQPQPLVPPVQPSLAGTFLNGSGECFNLNVTDAIPDAFGIPGLYRVTLSDGTGLRWTLYKADPPDGGGVAIFHVPYIGTGLNPLPFPPGPIDFQGSAYAWETLDVSDFMWTDIERECEMFAHTSATSFTPPTP